MIGRLGGADRPYAFDVRVSLNPRKINQGPRCGMKIRKLFVGERMTAERFGLLRAALWPLTTLVVVLMYREEIRNILAEVPSLARRLLSIKAPGVEISVESLSREIPTAEEIVRETTVPLVLSQPKEPTDGNR